MSQHNFTCPSIVMGLTGKIVLVKKTVEWEPK
jgi:hypothetical protein